MRNSFLINDYQNKLWKYKFPSLKTLCINKINELITLKTETVVIVVKSWNLNYCLNELEYCPNLRNEIKKKIYQINKLIILKVIPPDREVIDYKWNQITEHSIWQKVETDHVLSWLSTLGGAFSALGDDYMNCAEIAGKISIYQLKLALTFGDPLLVCRSKLYFSLALIQKGYLREAKHLIRQQYEFAKWAIEIDERLSKMCKGIWLKLQYSYSLRKDPSIKK